MSVYSMTGYATAQRAPVSAEASQSPVLGIEIRSVNSRFLDLTFKLADDLRATEPALREMLGKELRRGKVEVRAWIEGRNDNGPKAPTANELQKLNAIQDSVRAWLPQAATLSVFEVINLSSRQQSQSADIQESFQALATEAIGALKSAREREGKRLADMLLAHVEQLFALAERAKPLVPKLVEQQRTRFLERWQEALGAVQESDMARERALTEATAYAIRIDVAEELTRLHSHLQEIRQLLAKGGELGKRLDFLIQELHREANTLGSKSSSLELTRISVDMKVLIEQMREQVQNIE